MLDALVFEKSQTPGSFDFSRGAAVHSRGGPIDLARCLVELERSQIIPGIVGASAALRETLDLARLVAVARPGIPAIRKLTCRDRREQQLGTAGGMVERLACQNQ
jgi:hypothetical protein